jgi:signal transduction histidine kinase
VTPEIALPGTTSGERRRGPQLVVSPLRVWDPAGPTTSAIAPVLWEALRESVLWAQGEWERVIEHAAGAEEATAHLAALTLAVRQQASTGDASDAAVPRNPLSRRLLGVVRGAFLERVQALPAVDPGQLLRVLAAMEQVGQRLEADWSQHFADRLSAPDGLELVVEVAHDIRSPLTSILFLAETLQRGRSGPVNPVQERQLGLIYSAAFGLSSVASDVIELARGGDRLVDLDPIPFSVTDILESVRDIVQPIAEEKNLTVRLTAPEADFRIGHPVALSRVLLNLTTNALKFTAEGFVELTARQAPGGAIEFSVRDTGRGIPPQSMATLFEPFRRRQKPGEYAFSGSGLGLSICRKLVEAMGSTLQVETTQGVGTRFFFVLDLPLAGEATFG